VRPSLQALRGARITGFETVSETAWKLFYELNGERRGVWYFQAADGSVSFEFQNGREGVVRKVYAASLGSGASTEGDRPPVSRNGGGASQRNPDPEHGLRKPWIQGHGADLDTNNDSVISSAEFDGEAKRTFAGYDHNKDGSLSRDEYSRPGGVKSPMGGFVKEHPEKLDSDHDGTINEAEFLREVRKMFDKLDLNRDGNLSAAEWRDGPAVNPALQDGPPSGQSQRAPQKGVLNPVKPRVAFSFGVAGSLAAPPLTKSRYRRSTRISGSTARLGPSVRRTSSLRIPRT
jgi:hypothetical protein